MDKRALERFRKLLTQRRDELHNRLDAAKQHSRSHRRDEIKDEGDMATASLSAEMTALQRGQVEGPAGWFLRSSTSPGSSVRNRMSAISDTPAIRTDVFMRLSTAERIDSHCAP